MEPAAQSLFQSTRRSHMKSQRMQPVDFNSPDLICPADLIAETGPAPARLRETKFIWWLADVGFLNAKSRTTGYGYGTGYYSRLVMSRPEQVDYGIYPGWCYCQRTLVTWAYLDLWAETAFLPHGNPGVDRTG